MKLSIPVDDDHLVVFEVTTEDQVCPTCGTRRPRVESSTMTLYHGDYKHTVPCEQPFGYDAARAKAEAFVADTLASSERTRP